MRVAMYYNNHDIRLEEIPTPTIGPGELLVRVEASGICGSDVMEWYRLHKAPLVLGHEIAELKREFKSNYNPRLKERQVVDLSSLVLKKPDGTEIKLLKNNPMQIVVYRVKLYDSLGKRFLYAVEGSRLGDLTVYNITDTEVIFKDDNDALFTISKE